MTIANPSLHRTDHVDRTLEPLWAEVTKVKKELEEAGATVELK